MPKDEFVKVQFYESDIGYENLWASDLNKRRYQIKSIPFFVYGISVDDIVEAVPNEEGKLQFIKLLESSGNRTLRAHDDGFERHPDRRKQLITALKRRKCDAEEYPPNIVGINVPPSIDLEKITDYLTREAKVSWEYGNPEELNSD